MENMEPHIDTTVVVPAYNEEKGLPIVLEQLQKILTNSFEVIVVDDGSKDGTAAVARRYPCRIISHTNNRGKGEAMRTGVSVAQGKKIVFIDADGAHPTEMISKISSELEFYDMVVGSRARGHENIPMFNRLGNFLFRIALRYLYGSKAQDPLTGFLGVRKHHLEKMQLGSTGFGIESEIAIKAARMGLRILDMPIECRKRIGKAKLHPLRDGYRILKTILAFIMLYNPTVTFIMPGLALLAIGLVLMGMLLVGPIRFGSIVFGMHTTMIAAMLALVGFQGVVFGVATKLYALAHKFTMPDVVVEMVLRPGIRKTLAFLGAASVIMGFAVGWQLVAAWAQEGFGSFTRTQEAELVSFLVVFGFQLLLSVGFISIFVGEVLKKGEFDKETHL